MRLINMCGALVGCAVVCGSVMAQPVVIESPEAGINGNFGFDVDLRDGVLLVGASEGAGGDDQGDAYLFDAATGDLIAELFQSNGTEPSSVFGLSVSLGGGLAIVGGPGDELGEIDRAWVYDAGTGTLVNELRPPVGLGIEDFGIVVSMTETGAGSDPIAAVVGGRLVTSPTIRVQRYVHLYNARTGVNLANILPDEDSIGRSMGQEIDVYHDGTKGRLVVAANSSTFFAQPGARAYVFDITDPASPTQIASFIGADTTDTDEFAKAVTTDGQTIAATAPLRTGPGGETGAIYLFDADSGTEIGLLARPATLGSVLSGFAPNIAIQQGTLIYGTGDSTGGTTYVQSIDGTVIAELTSPGPTAQGVFGFAVAVDVTSPLIDAVVSDPIAPVGAGGAGAGEVYVFADVSGAGGECAPDLAEPFGILNFFDLSAFIAAFNAMDPAADVAPPSGVFNFFDVAEYIALFNAGCP